MFQIPLSALPNQSISFNLDGAYWQLRVFQAVNSMCADISRDGVPIVTGVRCYGGVALMQYPHMYQPNFGNFIFDSDADWTNFGTSCNLYYLQCGELEQFSELVLAATQ